MTGRIKKLGAVAILSLVGFATIVTLVQAQSDAIDQRRALMKANGAAMKAINDIVKAGGPVADLAPHATKLSQDAQALAPLFPAGSDQPQGKEPGQTMAKAEIWSNPDDFAAKLKAFQDESAMLQTAVAGGDMAAVTAQLEKVGGTCGGCHKEYRAK